MYFRKVIYPWRWRSVVLSRITLLGCWDWFPYIEQIRSYQSSEISISLLRLEMGDLILGHDLISISKFI